MNVSRNHHLPSRVLPHQVLLEAYPHAIHSGRYYLPESEEELLALEKVCAYLAQSRWFCSIRSNGFFGLGPSLLYWGKSFAQRSVDIRFDPDGMIFTRLPEGSEETIRLVPKASHKLSSWASLQHYKLCQTIN